MRKTSNEEECSSREMNGDERQSLIFKALDTKKKKRKDRESYIKEDGRIKFINVESIYR